MTFAMGSLCSKCVLTDVIPGIVLDDAGVCSACRAYEMQAASYERYFGTEADLEARLSSLVNSSADYDVLLMYSGGKDSTYVLYCLVDMGLRVLALTFDNGFIPQACFDNIRGVCGDLGVTSEIVSVPRANMNAVFARDLTENSAVCGGCFRALTARGSEMAIEKRIPVMMTGLSRGQICATKLQPLIAMGLTDPADMERYLRTMREAYHAKRDAIGTLVQDRALADRDAFRRVDFIDFYRYCAATKQDVVDLITARAPFWRKPENVGGCSSNCAINDVGIYVHMKEKGFHAYAPPTSWEVRLGHLTRDEALQELDEDIDPRRVQSIMNAIGYLSANQT